MSQVLRRFKIEFLTAVCFVGAISAPSLAATINVPADQPTVQAGIDAAVDGDTVLVAPGTFTENIDYTGKAIKLFGSGSDVTILKPAISSETTILMTNVASAGVEFAGFTVTGSEAFIAVRVDGLAPTIRNNVFIANNLATGGR